MIENIVFSTEFETMREARFEACCVHLLCLDGKACFTYNGRNVTFGRNDAVIVNRPSEVVDILTSADFRCEMFIAPLRFIYNQLPSNHYGIGGSVSLYNNPVIPLSEDDARRFHADLQRLDERLGDTAHTFHSELIGSLILTMVYDIFDFHTKVTDGDLSSNYTADIVSRLNQLLASGRVKTERTVTYYARQLHVSPRYLTETIKQKTGQTVMHLIDRAVIPLIISRLKSTNLPLDQIAREFNFSSLSYFTRYVKKHLGQTPTEYRSSLQPRIE